MEIITETLVNLLNQTGFMTLSYKNFIMVAVALFFLYLAIKKGYEPLLLVPISFGMLLVNLFPDIMMTVEEAKAMVLISNLRKDRKYRQRLLLPISAQSRL